jgi:hypothetical protein
MNALISQNPQVSIVTASKTLVDKLLAMNTNNRSTKKPHIQRMSHEIIDGKFYLTASGVGVSKTGVLLDGQHRLMAMKDAGYPPVKFVLATGLEEESQLVVDRHAKRTLNDALTLHMNITVSGHMVALANCLHFVNGARKQSQPFASASSGGLQDSIIARFMVDHAELAAQVVTATGQARASVTAAIFVYALHKPEEAMEFARDVAKGVNLSEDHPAYRLRAATTRLRSAAGASGRMEIFKLAAAACMAHSNGRTLKLLRTADSWSESRWKWAIHGESIFDQVD